jgi:membrane dipeptidase
MQVTSVEGFMKAKSQGKMGILFHFQNTLPLERDLELVDVYHALGVRVIQLTYNVKNFVGDGCAERTDAGLSDFGVNLIKEMNRAGIAVDCSHTGIRTTPDAMEVSERPVVFSHGNARAVCDNPRNLTDEQIKKVASVGGVIGLNGFPAFVSRSARPTLDEMLRHADYMADLVGIDHVGIGIDFFSGQAGVASDEESAQRYQAALNSGAWKPSAYPPPPYYYPAGLEDPRGFPNLTQALIDRGYTGEETKKVLAGNFMRVYSQIWR